MSSHIDPGLLNRLRHGTTRPDDLKLAADAIEQLRDRIDTLTERNTKLLSKIQEHEAREY
jgi:hypothetical protein